MEITELLELSDKAYEILGWRSGGSINLGYNVEEVGDLFWYIEIHQHAIDQYSDLLAAFSGLKAKLSELFGDKAGRFEFFDDEDANSGYSVAIPMASFSINSKGLRMKSK